MGNKPSDILITVRMKMEQKGWKTTEFILSILAIVIAAVISADVLPDGHLATKLVVAVGAILTSLGYTAARTSLKRDAMKLFKNEEKKDD